MINMKPLVLIAEDNSVNRNILVKILSDEYSLLQAENGIKALHAIHKHRDRLMAVILDLRMPGMSGEEILQELAKDQNFQAQGTDVQSGSPVLRSPQESEDPGSSDPSQAPEEIGRASCRERV